MLILILGVIAVVMLGLAAFNAPSLPPINWGWCGVFLFGIIWLINSGLVR